MKNLKDISTEELQKSVNVMKGVTYGLGIVLAFSFMVSAYVVFGLEKTKLMALLVVPVALMPVLLLNVKKIKDFKSELASREVSKI